MNMEVQTFPQTFDHVYIIIMILCFYSDDHAFSLLHWASREGQLSIVDMLLVRGARVNATNMGDGIFF